jgi:hypothetical protein
MALGERYRGGRVAAEGVCASFVEDKSEFAEFVVFRYRHLVFNYELGCIDCEINIKI